MMLISKGATKGKFVTHQPKARGKFPALSYVSSTSNSELMSASQSKHKFSALGEGDQSRKRSHPPSVAAMAQQEGSATLASIVQVLPQVLQGFTSSSLPASERPPSTDLGCAISSLHETDGLSTDDVMLITDYLVSNAHEAVILVHLHNVEWRATWVQRKLAALRGNK